MERDDPVRQHRQPVVLPAGGVWGTIRTIAGDEVTVSVTEYDLDTHYFGPVPFTGPIPSPGDRAFLHFDQRDRPAYAVTFA